MYKYFLGTISALLSSLAAPDPDGWVAVERPPRVDAAAHAGDHDDPSIWVLFSKQMEKEKFKVRFPEDPEYRYSAPDSLLAAAKKDSADYILTVSPGSYEQLEERAKEVAMQPDIVVVEWSHPNANTYDFLYHKDKKWVREHLYLSPHYLYAFQTTNDTMQGEGHRTFFRSLEIT